MKIIVDTSAYSALNRGGNPALHRKFTTKNELLVPTIVIGELRVGFKLGSRQSVNEELLQRFLDSTNVSTVTPGDTTTHLYAKVFAQLRKVGRPIGTNDMWIAALAMEHGCSLLTLDSDFASVAGLKLVKL